MKEVAKEYNIGVGLLKKYVRVERGVLLAPNGQDAHRPVSLNEAEDRAVNRFVQLADRGGFNMTNAALITAANLLRSQPSTPPDTPLGENWAKEWRESHPEFQFDKSVFEDKRIAIATRLPELEGWFAEIQAIFTEFGMETTLGEFDEPAFQAGDPHSVQRVLNIKNKGREREIVSNSCNNDGMGCITFNGYNNSASTVGDLLGFYGCPDNCCNAPPPLPPPQLVPTPGTLDSAP